MTLEQTFDKGMADIFETFRQVCSERIDSYWERYERDVRPGLIANEYREGVAMGFTPALVRGELSKEYGPDAVAASIGAGHA